MIDIIELWFKKAVPNPTDQNKNVQYGCHLEEFNEMLTAENKEGSDVINEWANSYKESRLPFHISDKVAFLDSLCDQIVAVLA